MYGGDVQHQVVMSSEDGVKLAQHYINCDMQKCATITCRNGIYTVYLKNLLQTNLANAP